MCGIESVKEVVKDVAIMTSPGIGVIYDGGNDDDGSDGGCGFDGEEVQIEVVLIASLVEVVTVVREEGGGALSWVSVSLLSLLPPWGR